jgi:hypothetical protein
MSPLGYLTVFDMFLLAELCFTCRRFFIATAVQVDRRCSGLCADKPLVTLLYYQDSHIPEGTQTVVVILLSSYAATRNVMYRAVRVAASLPPREFVAK